MEQDCNQDQAGNERNKEAEERDCRERGFHGKSIPSGVQYAGSTRPTFTPASPAEAQLAPTRDDPDAWIPGSDGHIRGVIGLLIPCEASAGPSILGEEHLDLEKNLLLEHHPGEILS